ncbi:hypothetical protein M0812_18567 [Anaeramoeba flamelloides]|uniref:Uncharacterized protein n=1 Tax=Anaeramoeba flamelloides TaxID=1746091 RepID=A0AAV7Z9Z6_9EUKA|nr:hypothetical protein M0812_18567 [Anaeramoeba flamelloides]
MPHLIFIEVHFQNSTIGKFAIPAEKNMDVNTLHQKVLSLLSNEKSDFPLDPKQSAITDRFFFELFGDLPVKKCTSHQDLLYIITKTELVEKQKVLFNSIKNNTQLNITNPIKEN